LITYTVTVEDNGDTWWYNQNDEYHRLDGPAVELVNGHKAWYQNDKRHRLDGPAVEYADGDKEWWIKNRKFTEKQFHTKIEAMNRYRKVKKIVLEGVKYK